MLLPRVSKALHKADKQRTPKYNGVNDKEIGMLNKRSVCFAKAEVLKRNAPAITPAQRATQECVVHAL